MVKLPDDSGDEEVYDDDDDDDVDVSYRVNCRWLWGVCWPDDFGSVIAAVCVMVHLFRRGHSEHGADQKNDSECHGEHS